MSLITASMDSRKRIQLTASGGLGPRSRAAVRPGQGREEGELTSDFRNELRSYIIIRCLFQSKNPSGSPKPGQRRDAEVSECGREGSSQAASSLAEGVKYREEEEDEEEEERGKACGMSSASRTPCRVAMDKGKICSGEPVSSKPATKARDNIFKIWHSLRL